MISISLIPHILKSLTKMLGGFTEIVFTPGYLVVSSLGSVARIRTGLTLSEENLAFSYQSISSALQGRSNPTLEIVSSSLVITDGKYRVELTPKQVPSVPKVEKPENPVTINLTDSLWAVMAAALPNLSVEKLHSAQLDPNLSVSIVGGDIFMGVQDKYQLAFKTDTVEHEDLELQIPYPKALLFFKDRISPSMRISIGEDLIYAKFRFNEIPVEVSVPWSRDEASPSIELVREKSLEIQKSKRASIRFDKAELTQFLENSRSVAQEDTRILIRTKGEYMMLSAESAMGNIRSRITLKSSVSELEFALELKFLQNLIKKLDEEVALHATPEILVAFSSKMILVSATSRVGS